MNVGGCFRFGIAGFRVGFWGLGFGLVGMFLLWTYGPIILLAVHHRVRS